MTTARIIPVYAKQAGKQVVEGFCVHPDDRVVRQIEYRDPDTAIEKPIKPKRRKRKKRR